MRGAVCLNVRDGFIESIDRLQAEDERQPFGVEIAVGGGQHTRIAVDARQRARVGAESHAGSAEMLDHTWQEIRRDAFIHEQDFERIADRRALDFGVVDDFERVIDTAVASTNR